MYGIVRGWRCWTKFERFTWKGWAWKRDCFPSPMQGGCSRDDDYGDAGNVQVRIFDDRLEVWSPGLLPPDLTIEALRRTHRSVPRNRLIAYAFFLIRFIEQWGTGTLRMMEVCQAAGLPEPEFAEITGAFVVTFRKSKLTREYLEGLGLNERQIAAVEYVRRQGRITNREYVDLTKVSSRTATEELRDLVSGRYPLK
jgi:ATP-dependent DNA helicase RecG